MYVGKCFTLPALWHFARKNLIRTALISVVACALYASGYTEVAIPFLPLATIGTAVAFHIGFKNNQAYDRQ
jgi:putative membrane protein